MMQPKKRKYTKEHRGRMKGNSKGGTQIAYGDFALQATSRSWVNGRQIEAARQAIARYTKRRGKLWLGIFPHKPVTEKGSEVTRGSGKGPVKEFVAVVKPGRIIFELGGLPEEIAREALRRGAQKFPLKTRIISKN
jgi:large subunit ribosomal protein L16